jgi:hypothetical protein
MAKTVKENKPSRLKVKPSYVKHTPAGEMPDPSTVGEITRRIQADLPVLSNEWRHPKVWFSLLTLILVYGSFRLWKG